MKLSKVKMSCALAVAGIAISTASLKAQSKLLSQYHIYSGNTHSHTAFTRSHGAQFKHLPGFKKLVRSSWEKWLSTGNCTGFVIYAVPKGFLLAWQNNSVKTRILYKTPASP